MHTKYYEALQRPRWTSAACVVTDLSEIIRQRVHFIKRWTLVDVVLYVVGSQRLMSPDAATSTHTLSASFTCRKYATWDKRLYFSSEGRRAEDFFALKNPTASAEFEPANLGTKSQHATSRPPKALVGMVTNQRVYKEARFLGYPNCY